MQQAGLALLALGVSETALSLLGDESFAVPLLDRYYQALAQPSSRKLALLVGINQYPRGTPLGGCVTDVELQRELLIHRFGFHPRDILTLTDTQATRENIETAFLEHLTKQAAAGDVVVFHFSGYGSRVTLSPESETNNPSPSTQGGAAMPAPTALITQNSLVPADGVLSAKETGSANNLLEETLLLLLRSLATDQVTTILDTSYTNTDSVLQGNLRIRSCPSIAQDRPSAEELAFQEQLLQKIKTSREQLKQQMKNDQTGLYSYLPGIVLAAAGPSQPATEAPWGGFSAGLFTYALTQHLWQAAPPTTVQISISRAAGVVEQLVGNQQQPTISGQKSREQRLQAYHLTPDPRTCADGAIVGLEDNGKVAQLWLAGLPATVLEYYGANSLLTLATPRDAMQESPAPTDSNPTGVVPATTTQPLQLQIRSKDGLSAKARIIGGGTPENDKLLLGQLVQESIRMLPRNIGLTVAIDARLERIERVDATSAFANIPSISSVVAARDQPADYLFGRVAMEVGDRVKEISAAFEDSSTTAAVLVAKSSSITATSLGGYGLFSLGLDPIPNTSGQAGEAVKVAVNRLTPKLRTLLATKLWRLTANEGSSRLGVRATLELVSPTKQVLSQRQTLRFDSAKPQQLPLAGSVQQLSSKLETSTLPSAPRTGAASVLQHSLTAIPTVPIGGHIQYQIHNQNNQPLHILVVGNDSSGNAIAIYPPQSSPAANVSEINFNLQDAVIPAGATLTVPNPAASFDWVVQGPPGLAQVYIICSRAPFTQTLAALADARGAKRDREQVGDLYNSLDVARAVLQDLHDASAWTGGDATSASSDTYALDVNAWATLSFVYQVA